MKLIQYMQYLKKLHHRYGGDIDVKTETQYKTMGEKDFEHTYGYTDVSRPRYAKNKKCVVIYKNYVIFLSIDSCKIISLYWRFCTIR